MLSRIPIESKVEWTNSGFDSFFEIQQKRGCHENRHHHRRQQRRWQERALHVARRGTGVILTYNTHADEAEAAVSEIKQGGGKAVALKLDVSQIGSFGEFVDLVSQTLENEWSQRTFDYLVNNAGTAQRTLIKDTTPEQFDHLMNVHFKGPFFLTQKLIPLMADGGLVLNISSGLTRFTNPAGVATYASLKGAMEIFTKYIVREYASRKIRREHRCARCARYSVCWSQWQRRKSKEDDRRTYRARTLW